MADESCVLESDVERAAAHFEGFNIKLVKCGGITPALEMLHLGKSLGLKVMIGCMLESSLLISAGAVVAQSSDYADLDVLSPVADNSWNGGIVLSEFATKWPDLEGVLGRAAKDQVAIGEGHGRDILGHPFNSVGWLANELAARGARLKAGQVVMTGSVMKTVFPADNAAYQFELSEIGRVEVVLRN